MIADLHPLVNILLLSLMAGLGTGLGGLLAVIRRPGKRSYGLLMGITAGVMICLAFLELVNEAIRLSNYLVTTVGFASGAIFMFMLDTFAPHIRFGEREVRRDILDENCEPCQNTKPRRLRLFRRHEKGYDRKLVNTGMLLAVGITLHNLPEGIAVGAGYMHNPDFGLFIAIAIMLHNIPEGIATALPLCKGGVCRSDAFRVVFFPGWLSLSARSWRGLSWSISRGSSRQPWPSLAV